MGFTFQWGAFAFQLDGASFLSEEVQVDWTPSLVLKKNSLKHAAKIHGGQSELPEQRYLKMTVLMML